MRKKIKELLSQGVRRFREGFKKGAAKLSQKVLRSLSYPLFAVPSGLVSQDHKIEELYPESVLKVPIPKTLKKPLSCFSEEESMPSDGICELPFAFATGLGGNLDSRGQLITTYLQPLDGKPPHLHDLFRFSTKRFFPRIYRTNEPIVTLAAGWQGAFYHWMYDVLPRLHLVEKKGIEGRLFLEAKTPFQRESLRLLGIADESILNARDYDAVWTPKLFVPSISQKPTEWGCKFLRDKFLPKLTRKEKKRVYISREDASRRRIRNEEEIFSLLKKKGFEKVTLSPLSFQEQMEVFYNAEVIIGPHGAGFSHLVFCDPKTPFLEIFSPAYVNPCYWQLSNRTGLNYYYLLGKENFAPDPKDPDIDVDLEEFKLSLKLMGL